MNNLPKVVARQCHGWELNPRPPDHESNMLATTPPSHRYIQSEISESSGGHFHLQSCFIWRKYGADVPGQAHVMYGNDVH